MRADLHERIGDGDRHVLTGYHPGEVRLTFAVAACVVALMARHGRAHAYPSSVVFAPTGEARGLGEIGVFVYGGGTIDKRFIPGVTWAGLQGGIFPKIEYGSSGVAFGGVEVGADLFSADLQGSPDAFVKPVANLKIQPLTEYGALPAVGLGIFGLAPTRTSRSLNLAYGSLTKSLTFGERSYGRITLGIAAVVYRAEDPNAEAYPLYRGSFPFPASSRYGVIAGYTSPPFGRFGIAIDHVGGISEISSTNAALGLTPVPGATWAVGGWMQTAAPARSAGVFTYIAIDFRASALWK